MRLRRAWAETEPSVSKSLAKDGSSKSTAANQGRHQLEPEPNIQLATAVTIAFEWLPVPGAPRFRDGAYCHEPKACS